MKSYSERAEATREKIKAYKNKAKARRRNILISVVSLCSCLLIALNLVIFIPSATYPSGGVNPGPSGSINPDEYENSDYSGVIKQLSAILGGGSGEWDMDDEVPDASGSSGTQSPDFSGSSEYYEETTDNQVAGVIEGDLIKRTNKYIYYLFRTSTSIPTLRVYPIDGAQTECITEFAIMPQEESYGYGYGLEMYLSEDGSTVTLVLPMTHYWWEGTKYYNERYTEVVNIDVTDHSDIKITERYCVSGRYVSSRLVDGELLLVTNFSVPYYVDFSDEKQFIPATGAEGAMSCIPAKDIHCPEKPVYARFTVVCSVNMQTLEETGREAFLSYSENVYVSENNIYLTNTYGSYTDLLSDKSRVSSNDYHYVSETKTEISRVEYGGELDYKGSFTVLGSVLNRFCIDEKEGVLRVVTSPNRYECAHIGNNYNSHFMNGASLYCVDIESYETVGKLENFAPEEDSVRSARFDGDKVYVCTAVVMTDPVFAIDISDYNNIHFVDTGEIPGYSIALRKFYGDTLLGIGYDSTGWSSRDLKIELYKETESSVESAATFTYADDGYWNDTAYDYVNIYFSTEYKAYFIDAERGLIGLGLTVEAYNRDSYNSSLVTSRRYILLQYDGENLNLLLDVDLGRKTDFYFYNTTRAVYVDGTFYVFTANGLTVTELNV